MNPGLIHRRCQLEIYKTGVSNALNALLSSALLTGRVFRIDAKRMVLAGLEGGRRIK
jgi:hypothetical protein